MKYIKPYYSINESTFSNDDFEKIFDYFANEVFIKKDEYSLIIEDSLISLGFIEILKPRLGTNKLVDNPYYGVIKGNGSTGLSYEFMRIMNDGTKDINVVKGWNHAWYSAYYSYLMPRSSFGKIEHGYPYYEYKVDIKIVDDFLKYSIKDVEKLLQRTYTGYDITKYISNQIKRMGSTFNPKMDIDVRVRCYDKRSDDFYTLEIWIIDKEYVPNDILKIPQII